MQIKIQKNKAKEIIDSHIEECSVFLDTNNVSLTFAKEKANEWYQKLIEDLDEIFYDPQLVIDEMNKILSKDINPIISSSSRYIAPSITGDEYYKKTQSFNNKVKGIIDYLKEIKENI